MTDGIGSIRSEGIYLDHNATTPIAAEALDAMRPYLEQAFGNPSSAHRDGALARAAVERARAEVAALLGGEPDGVVFTASGSEADNLAITGVALARLGERDHLITSAVEHPAVLATCRYLRRRFGFRVTVVPVDAYGVVDPDDVRRAIERGTVLVSVMHANNEVGTVQPIAKIAAAARERGARPHRRRAIGRQAAARRRCARRRPAHRRRPQALRPEGDRRAVRASGHRAGPRDPRWRTGGRPAGGDRERALHRRRDVRSEEDIGARHDRHAQTIRPRRRRRIRAGAQRAP